MTAKTGNALKETLARLEKAYGPLVTPGDPVEGGVLALLASTAPSRATEETRDRIRQAFVDWNEARTSDAWDITNAIDAGPAPEAREFARAMLRFLESVHTVLNRCSFDVAPGEPVPDWVASLEKMRGATPAVRAVCLAMLTPDDGWHVTPEMLKAALRIGIVAKTTSAQKVGAALAEACPPADRLRAHYLLARYGARAKDDPDPLGLDDKGEKKKPAPKPSKNSKKH